MGDESYINGINGFFLFNGEKIGFTKLTTAKFADANGDEIASRGPVFEIPESMEFRISRRGYYMLTVGTDERMIRRAIRWEEKLRRKGVSASERRSQAADKARWGGNNGKRKRAKVWGVLVIGNAAG